MVTFNPVAGLHVYVVAPLAISPMVSPLHIAGAIPVMDMLTVGVGFTVRVTVAVSEQLPLTPTTV